MSDLNTAADQRGYRLTSIDMLRGLVIIIMALDHVRDFFMEGAQQDPMNNPEVGTALYFTRWITHFCAPVFVFLAGTSAGLMVARKSPAELGKFLLTRGVWLVFVEWFVMSTAISFAPFGSAQFGGKIFMVLQVIWAIGMSMIVLAACQFLGRKVCLLLGAIIVLGHNVLDGIWPTQQTFGDPSHAVVDRPAHFRRQGVGAVLRLQRLSVAAVDRRDAAGVWRRGDFRETGGRA